jgi:hypothetical protein
VLQRKNNTLSVGLLLQHDQAGDAGLEWLQAGIAVGVAHTIWGSHQFGAGFGVEMVQRRVDISRLNFKNQWAGDFFDPGRANGETFNQNSSLKPVLSAGVHWRYAPEDPGKRLELGVGMGNINRPVVSLGDFGAPMDRRITFFANGFWPLNAWQSLVVLNQMQYMGKAKEVVLGAGIRRVLTKGIANEQVLQMTFSYRVNDALIPALQIERNNWTLGLSYDWNISSFSTASRGRGGIEIAVIWRKIPVKSAGISKACPVY